MRIADKNVTRAVWLFSKQESNRVGKYIPKSRIGGGIEMTEKLGVLLLELPNSWYRYILLTKSEFSRGKLTIWETDDKEKAVEYAYKCTKEEAKKYPQFRWVSLEEL